MAKKKSNTRYFMFGVSILQGGIATNVSLLITQEEGRFPNHRVLHQFALERIYGPDKIPQVPSLMTIFLTHEFKSKSDFENFTNPKDGVLSVKADRYFLFSVSILNEGKADNTMVLISNEVGQFPAFGFIRATAITKLFPVDAEKVKAGDEEAIKNADLQKKALESSTMTIFSMKEFERKSDFEDFIGNAAEATKDK